MSLAPIFALEERKEKWLTVSISVLVPSESSATIAFMKRRLDAHNIRNLASSSAHIRANSHSVTSNSTTLLGPKGIGTACGSLS